MLIPLLAAALLATPATDSLVYNGREGRTAVRPTRIVNAPRIDGRLDEAEWRNAAVLTGFSQYSPVDKLPAQDSTEVRVMYTDHEMFVGIRAFEPHGSVHGNLADRDKILADDYVQINLDTFDDKRRAIVLIVNALGIQADGMLAENGTSGEGQLDLSPDFLFYSKGHVTADGYEVELRIPFKSLRYQSKEEQQWGIQIVRSVKHSGHRQTWTQADRGASSFLAQSGRLEGMTGLKRGLVMDINPVLTTRVDGAQNSVGSSWKYDYGRPEIGGNVRWGIAENVTLNATANPDFSQIESDASQAQYDPRQALFFQEKRPFFLEGSENFSVGNSLVYTRSIVAPLAAAKLTGKVSGLNVGFLSALDDEANSASDNNPLFNILRLRKDLGSRSNVGAVYTDRIDGSDYNRVAGVDTRIVRGAFTFSGQYAASFTRDGAFTSNAAPLFDFRFARNGRDWGFNTQLSGIHPDFVAGAGFLSRGGVGRFNVSPRKSWYGEKGAKVEQFTLGSYINGTWDYERFRKGTVANDVQVHLITSAVLRGGWNFHAQPWIESFMYPAELYTDFFTANAAGTDTVPYVGVNRITNIGGQFIMNTPDFKKFSGGLNLTLGRDVNFAEWAEAWILFTEFHGLYRPTEKLRFDGSYVEQRFHRMDGSLVSLRQIPRLKVEYQIARPIFVRMVTQYDATRRDALRDDSRTNAPILRRRADGTFAPIAAVSRGGVRTDWLFSYQPSPGTVVFAGYGSTLNNPLDAYGVRDMDRTADGFFLKLSYLFRM